MDRKSICFVAVVLLLALATTSYGIVIGDFEQWMDDWVETWQTEATFSYSTIGATRGAYSLAIKPNKTGYQWVVMNNGLMDLDSYPILSADVTWIAAEWGSTRWVNLKDVAVNSAAGWFQVIPEDPVSPDWPGDWNPVGCGDHGLDADIILYKYGSRCYHRDILHRQRTVDSRADDSESVGSGRPYASEKKALAESLM
jgi:hypothetical protein